MRTKAKTSRSIKGLWPEAALLMLQRMLRLLTSIPTRGTKCADRPEWIQKIKNDGHRLIIQREATRVRLFARKGHDWSNRFLLITAAALRNRNSSFVIDGEAVLFGVNGRSVFNGLHSRRRDDEVQFYAFDVLAEGGEDSAQVAAVAAQGLPGAAADTPRRQHPSGAF